MARLRLGDDEAAAEVFRRFVGRLIHFTRGQLATWARHKADPEDVVQSVYRSFFARYGAGQFEVADWDSLWGLLTVITLRKCANRIEYWQAARRDVRREEHVPCDETPETPWNREPTPYEAAVLTETMEHLMQELPELDREILALHLQGCEIPEISRRVGRAIRTVRRTLERIRKRLCRLQRATDGP